MAKYSRVSKYEELRNRLQNDTDTTFASKDLSRFEKKLNEINSNNFEAPKTAMNAEDYDPIHARRRQYLDSQEEIYPSNRSTKEENLSNTRTTPIDLNSINNPFNNDYINDYIREVKQYNKERGNAFSTNTDLNVLHSIKKEEIPDIPKTPYVSENKNRNRYYDEEPQNFRTEDSYTSEIPQFKSSKRTFDEFMNDDNEDLNTSTMTKDDIAAEVQNLIRGQGSEDSYIKEEKTNHNVKNDALDYHFEAERNARQQLLNETTQMRAQLDNYEDNLSEVSSKMQHTDKMISNVLIVLIIVLVVVLFVVVYWILSANGVLG